MNKNAKKGKLKMPKSFGISEDMIEFCKRLSNTNNISVSCLVDEFFWKLHEKTNKDKKPLQIKIKRLEFDIKYEEE